MPYSVVCISTADGAAGDEVASLVASRLGFRLVNEQIVARAADEAGVESEVVASVERRRSLITRILEELPTAAAGGSPLAGFTPVEVAEPTPARDQLRGLIRSAIEEIASQGDAVILSHAASHALASRDDVLRVLVTASPETRRARLCASGDVSEKQAEKLVARSDAGRADYFRRFYGVQAELPTHYDIVVNSDRLTTEQAADIISGSARS